MAGKAFTGGKEEYGARMEMAQMGQKMLQQQNANYQAKQLSTLRQQQIAKNKFDSASKPFVGAFKDMDAYLDNQRVHTEGIQTAIEAGNRPVYEQGVQAQTSLYKAYKEAHPNSDVPPPITPPFVKESEMKAISEAQQGISEQRQALSGMKETEPWISPSMIPSFVPKGDTLRSFGSNREAISAKKEEVGALEEAMQALPGAKEYLSATPQARASAGAGAATGSRAGQIVNGYPLGQKRVNPQTQEWIVWDGSGWKPLQ